jgi:hypothetical protein
MYNDALYNCGCVCGCIELYYVFALSSLNVHDMSLIVLRGLG